MVMVMVNFIFFVLLFVFLCFVSCFFVYFFVCFVLFVVVVGNCETNTPILFGYREGKKRMCIFCVPQVQICPEKCEDRF